MDAQPAFVRHEMIARDRAAAACTRVCPAWLRQRLFGSVLNTVLTIVSAVAAGRL